MVATVSPEGQIVISAEMTSALDLKAEDSVCVRINPQGLVLTLDGKSQPELLRSVPATASLEEKKAFYTSTKFTQSFTDGVNAALDDLREIRLVQPKAKL